MIDFFWKEKCKAISLAAEALLTIKLSPSVEYQSTIEGRLTTVMQ